MDLVSAETTLGPFRASGSGTLKQERAPVLVLLGAKRDGQKLSCLVALTHAGLVPGPYPLSDGTTVHIPERLVGTKARFHVNVTLEVHP